MQQIMRVDYVVEKDKLYWTTDINGNIFWAITLFSESYFSNREDAKQMAQKYNANVRKCTTTIELEEDD